MSALAALALALGVALVLLSALALPVARDTYDALHFVSLAGVGGGGLVAVAAVLDGPFGADTVKSLLILGLIALAGPVLTHATARAAHRRRADRGDAP